MTGGIPDLGVAVRRASGNLSGMRRRKNREEISTWAKRKENEQNEKLIRDQRKKDGATSYSRWVQEQHDKHRDR